MEHHSSFFCAVLWCRTVGRSCCGFSARHFTTAGGAAKKELMGGIARKGSDAIVDDHENSCDGSLLALSTLRDVWLLLSRVITHDGMNLCSSLLACLQGRSHEQALPFTRCSNPRPDVHACSTLRHGNALLTRHLNGGMLRLIVARICCCCAMASEDNPPHDVKHAARILELKVATTSYCIHVPLRGSPRLSAAGVVSSSGLVGIGEVDGAGGTPRVGWILRGATSQLGRVIE